MIDLLSLAEVAELLHCSKAHVANIVGGRVKDCPVLPAIRLGRRKLVKRETLSDWVSRNEAANDNEGKGHGTRRRA